MRLLSVLLLCLAVTETHAASPPRLVLRQEPSGAPPAVDTPTPSPAAPDPPSSSQSPVISDPTPVAPDPPPVSVPSDPVTVTQAPDTNTQTGGTPTSSTPTGEQVTSSAVADWPCRSECNDPGSGSLPSLCQDKTSEACRAECRSNSITICMDCVKANAGNPQVEERYRERIEGYWNEYQVPFCEADTPCGLECDNPGAGYVATACGESKASTWCQYQCGENPIRKCLDCVKTNSGNQRVQELYLQKVNGLYDEYIAPWCDLAGTKFGLCPLCDQLSALLPNYRNCTTKEECQSGDGCSERILSLVNQCKACMDVDSKATSEGKAEMDNFLSWRQEWCTGTTITDCSAECETIGAAMNASCTDGNIACSGLCPNYQAAEKCWTCQNRFDFRYAYPQAALSFYCEQEEGKNCAWVGATYAKDCAALTNKSECVLCGGADSRPALDKCNKDVPISDLYAPQQATVMDALAQVYAGCIITGGPNPKGCAQECESILQRYTDMCPRACNGMCTAENLDAMDVCNACAHSNESVYSDTVRTRIRDHVAHLADWCNTIVIVENITTTIPVKPPGSVQVPDPRDIKNEVDRENRNPPPRNTTTPRPNPFGNTTVPINTKSDSTGGGGIPTWGIGVAAAGSVVVVAGAAAAIIANGYECDPDHRRLRRKKKNKKKKNNNNDMPAPEWQQEPEKPQVVGYMMPTQEYAPVPTQEPPNPQYGQHYAQAPYGQSSGYPQGGRY
ncbi:hypothetical protein CC85DRAFT_314520 [Cutaneotrichosporon oleaginosum]|uniref:Uncharacterized protein n=1 Tax=Cutaneotrichosporon oleaginosum TaxID=879819 RepID=A0A0J0XZ34_9TREE|nr:uncharacterized protein CC85DRAFT_314520 [Cutaneotrichosporon oleaginosum]KLT46325.1 hypothetical protein CC85DRAFT_314520 [Cutaneotrichosporon oleaginosum]TXT15303.1 hypothetical protein COLE_01496 [Cutaneotrichosporon oleaginosum]